MKEYTILKTRLLIESNSKDQDMVSQFRSGKIDADAFINWALLKKSGRKLLATELTRLAGKAKTEAQINHLYTMCKAAKFNLMFKVAHKGKKDKPDLWFLAIKPPKSSTNWAKESWSPSVGRSERELLINPKSAAIDLFSFPKVLIIKEIVAISDYSWG